MAIRQPLHVRHGQADFPARKAGRHDDEVLEHEHRDEGGEAEIGPAHPHRVTPITETRRNWRCFGAPRCTCRISSTVSTGSSPSTRRRLARRTPDAEFIRKQPFAWRAPGIIIEVGFVEMLREGEGWRKGETWRRCLGC